LGSENFFCVRITLLPQTGYFLWKGGAVVYQKRYLGIKPVQIVQPLDTGSNGIKRNDREPGQQAFDKECARPDQGGRSFGRRAAGF